MRPGRVRRVLGQLQQLQRFPPVPHGRARLTLERVEARERPVDAGTKHRVTRVLRLLDGLLEDAFCLVELVVVDVRVGEQDAEAHRLGGVLTLVRSLERLPEEPDRRLQVVEHRVGPAEDVGERRLLGRLGTGQRERLLELLRGSARLAALEGDLTETGQRP